MNKVYAVNGGDWHLSTKHGTSQCTTEQYNISWAITTGRIEIASKPPETKTENVLVDNTMDPNDSVNTVLEKEKSQHKYNASLRTKVLQKISTNEAIELELRKFICGILITILGIAAAPFVFTLIPAHNLILDQSYWYKILWQSFPWCTWLGIYTTYVLGYYFNIDYMKGARHVLVACVITNIILCLVIIITYYIWTDALHFKFPVPFLGYSASYVSNVVVLTTFWFRFPAHWRRNDPFRRRFKMVILLEAFSMHVVPPQYTFASMLLFNYQNEYQPIIAFLFIIIREVNAWIVSKFITKTASGDESGAQFVGSSFIGISNTVMIYYQVGSSATLETSILIMGLDFAINIFLTLRLVWIRKRRPQDIEKHIDLLQELARNELVELLAPLAFVIAFVVAYYGPNSGIIGGVGATIWQFVAIV